jgi:hypothetical protein
VNQVRRFVPGWFAAMIVGSAAICLVGISRPPVSNPTAPSSQVEVQNNKELYDVLWLDRYPEMASDTFHAYSFTSDNIGLTMDFHSAYKLTLELFEFKANNSQITFHFPHDARRAKVNYKIEKLKKPTRHFDVSLTVENDPFNSGATKTYYSGPNFRSLQTLPSPIREQLERSGALRQLESR